MMLLVMETAEPADDQRVFVAVVMAMHLFLSTYFTRKAFKSSVFECASNDSVSTGGERVRSFPLSDGVAVSSWLAPSGTFGCFHRGASLLAP